MGGLSGKLFVAGALVLASSLASSQGSIYMCVDGKGRRLTSDRPIIDCIDREQTELSPSGQIVRRIGPSLTAQERAAEEEKQRRAVEEKSRLADEKRKDLALLSRYPDQATHDRERVSAAGVVEEVIKAANRRIVDLQAQRKKLDVELEFYKTDAKKTPAQLKRQIDELDQQIAGQKRFIANQEEERRRIASRYDQELVRLRPLWIAHAAAAAASTRK